MKASKKKVGIIIAAILLLCFAGFVFFMQSAEEKLKERLTGEQIEALRAEYPVCGAGALGLITIEKVDIAKVKEAAETFVYGEVVEEAALYNAEASFSNADVAEKRENSGITDAFEFYEYTLSVIQDSEGKYAKGERITIAANTDFMDYNPSLSNGMKVVVPVVRDEEIPTRHYYTVDGMYYVTPEGYALAAFEESEAAASQGLSSGARVEALMKALKK